MKSLLLLLSDDDPSNAIDDIIKVDPAVFFRHELNLLFSSRSRLPFIDEMPLISHSVVNYGFDETNIHDYEPLQRAEILKKRIVALLQRFEPRLAQVDVDIYNTDAGCTLFHMRAQHEGAPLLFKLGWDNCLGRFYFDE